MSTPKVHVLIALVVAVGCIIIFAESKCTDMVRMLSSRCGVNSKGGVCCEPWAASKKMELKPKKCKLPADGGSCKAYITRFYFDVSSGKCQDFVYGGCRGNANNFKTQDLCEETCGNLGHLLMGPCPSTCNSTSECTLPRQGCRRFRSGCKHCTIGMPGRPFIVEGNSRNTISIATDKGLGSMSWKLGKGVTKLENSSISEEIGRRWLEQGEGEHASVASFARHTLQLMSIGAPAELLEASQQSAVDEVRHSKLCYGLASSFLGCNYEPGTLDIETSLDKPDLKKIVRSLIQEGCVEETISAVEARLGAYTAHDAVVKSVATQIASDETNHAQIAWNTIYWIKKRFSEIGGFVEETFRLELENSQLVVEGNELVMENPVCMECKVDETLKKYGLVVQDDKDKIRKATFKSIIEPIYLTQLKGANLISTKIRSLDLDNL